MTALRIIIGVLLAAAIGVALIPLAVLLDLHECGSGWGLCPQGLENCRNGYFTGFEMVAWVVVALFLIVVTIAACVRLMRQLDRRRRRSAQAKAPNLRL
jgi:hypothetical protein